MENFTKTYETIKRSLKLNDGEKALISHIIGFQENNLICYQSNIVLGRELGKTEGAIRKIIFRLNKNEWFSTEKKYNGNKTSTHNLSIDMELLYEFLGSKLEQPEKIKKTEEVIKPTQPENKKLVNNKVLNKFNNLVKQYQFPEDISDYIREYIKDGTISSEEQLISEIENHPILNRLYFDEHKESEKLNNNN